MLQRKLTHLLNGGGKVAGVDGLQGELYTLREAMGVHQRELAEMPSQRLALLQTDEPDEALDRLELRERALYRHLEKGALQIAAIETRLAEMRFAQIQPRIDHHRAALKAASERVEEAISAALVANEAAFAAFEDAVNELGRDDANRLMPVVHFASFLNADGLQLWREQLHGQHERIARQHGRATP
jgi:hypothetical protein